MCFAVVRTERPFSLDMFIAIFFIYVHTKELVYINSFNVNTVSLYLFYSFQIP